MDSKARWPGSVFAAALVASILMTPAGAHVGRRVGHLGSAHILPRVGALPDCRAGEYEGHGH